MRERAKGVVENHLENGKWIPRYVVVAGESENELQPHLNYWRKINKNVEIRFTINDVELQ